MDDKTIMGNLLTVTKSTCDLMMHGSIESPTPDVHVAFSKTLNDSLSLQSQIYAHMAEKGWYSVQQAEQQKIQQLRQQFR